MDRVVGRAYRTKDEVVCANGVVTAKHPLAAEAAIEVLERGGNAVDAAVVGELAAGVCLPLASGIGGGGFLLYHEAASGRTYALDYANRSPAAASPDVFPRDPYGGFGTSSGWQRVVDHANWHGWRSMCVPGAVAGLSLALARFGTLSWAEALAPSIRLAEEGLPMPSELLHAIISDWSLIAAHPSSFATFTDQGRPYKLGERFRRPALARTLRRLAKAGPDDLYQGQLARDIAADVQAQQAHGGLLTEDDLRAYHPRLSDQPLSLDYRGVTVLVPPGSGGGITALEILGLLSHHDVSALGRELGAGDRRGTAGHDVDAPCRQSAALLHLWDQASRLAFADRYQYLSDPEHVVVPWDGLLDPAYTAQRATLFDPDRPAAARFDAGNPWPFDPQPRPPVTYTPSRPLEAPGTLHLNVVDRNGNAVALTDTTVGWSGVVLPRSGIVMNNAMTWFDPEPGHANSIRGRSRGVCNMAPTILLRDGRLFAALGARGGRRIIGTVAQVVSDLVDHHLGIQQAVSGPHTDSSEPALRLTKETPASVTAQLTALGHRLNLVVARPGAGASGILLDAATGLRHAGEDPTTEGLALGY